MRIVIIPGMGCSPVATSNWYSWFANEMAKKPDVTCILRDFPDPNRCRESIWLPFLQNEIGLDENTIIVGHSSGAACAMRLLENESVGKLRGAILVASAYTDLGDEDERLSEYCWRMSMGMTVSPQHHFILFGTMFLHSACYKITSSVQSMMMNTELL